MCINFQSKVFIACSLAFLLLAARMYQAEARERAVEKQEWN